MAKQVKIDSTKKTTKTADRVNAPEGERRLAPRSPLTNLFFAAILGILYLTVFNQSPQQSLVYSIGAFLFFNTIDYCILYYRITKRSK